MKYLLISLFVSVSSPLLAQPLLPSKVEVKKPVLLQKDHPNEDDLNSEFKSGVNSKWGQKRALNQFWIAYSDRDNNTAYMAPDINSAKSPKKLDFGAKVYIAKIKKDMALVYTDTHPEVFPKISSVARSVGWVPMDNLLLWNTCPADKRGVTNKAIIAIKLNEMGQGEQYQDRLYTNPDDHSGSQPLSMDMNFYFVMKTNKDDTYALLCLQSTFTGNNLYGWVKKNSYTPWNHRIFLEPNWSSSYVNSHLGERAYVYSNEKANREEEDVMCWEFGWKNGDWDSSMQYRMDPRNLRFPVLSPPNEDGIVKCMCLVSNLKNSNNGFEYNTTFLKNTLAASYYRVWKYYKQNYVHEGYIRLIDRNGEPYWRYTLFLSDDELDVILRRIQPIADVALRMDERKPYIDAMKGVVRAQLKEEMTMSDRDLENMTPDELDEIIYGINIPTVSMDRLTGHSIKEISNSTTFPPADYFELLNNVKTKYEGLRRIQNSDYRYKMTVNHVDYYWIPLEELP